MRSDMSTVYSTHKPEKSGSLGASVSLINFEESARHDSVPLLFARSEDPFDDADEAAVRVEALVHRHAERFLRSAVLEQYTYWHTH